MIKSPLYTGGRNPATAPSSGLGQDPAALTSSQSPAQPPPSMASIAIAAATAAATAAFAQSDMAPGDYALQPLATAPQHPHVVQQQQQQQPHHYRQPVAAPPPSFFQQQHLQQQQQQRPVHRPVQQRPVQQRPVQQRPVHRQVLVARDGTPSDADLEAVTCPIETCRRIFRSPGGVTYHLRRTHRVNLKTVTKVFTCPHDGCDKTFTTRPGLRYHVGRHQGDEPTIRCPVDGCTKRFYSPGGVRYHMKHGTHEFGSKHGDPVYTPVEDEHEEESRNRSKRSRLSSTASNGSDCSAEDDAHLSSSVSSTGSNLQLTSAPTSAAASALLSAPGQGMRLHRPLSSLNPSTRNWNLSSTALRSSSAPPLGPARLPDLIMSTLEYNDPMAAAAVTSSTAVLAHQLQYHQQYQQQYQQQYNLPSVSSSTAPFSSADLMFMQQQQQQQYLRHQQQQSMAAALAATSSSSDAVMDLMLNPASISSSSTMFGNVTAAHE